MAKSSDPELGLVRKCAWGVGRPCRAGREGYCHHCCHPDLEADVDVRTGLGQTEEPLHHVNTAACVISRRAGEGGGGMVCGVTDVQNAAAVGVEGARSGAGRRGS